MADIVGIAKPTRSRPVAASLPASREGRGLSSGLDSVLYWGAIIVPVILTPFLFLRVLYDPIQAPSDTLHSILYWSKFFWFTGVLVTASNIAGFLFFGSPRRRTSEAIASYRGWDENYLLTLCYVSRGDNTEALARALRNSIAELEDAGVAYHIEVVTDKPVAAAVAAATGGRAITFYLVPPSYETPHKTKFKARALQYALEERSKAPLHLQANAGVHRWLLHMDEESTVTPSVIAGISRFITNPANREKIGQGEIKYNAYNYGKNILITAMDSVRTGDDLGRFRLQFALFGRPLFGMHGSFILVSEYIERRVGFDLGRKGSVTEDAYFALLAAQQGIRFGWVDGFIREQSPFTIRDILRQRRRWFSGLSYLSFDPAVSLRYRASLMIFTILWSVAWLGSIVTVLNILLGGGYFPFALAYAAALIQGGNGAIYLLGAYYNTEDSGLPFGRKIFIAGASLVLLPVSSALEGLGVLYAIVYPVKTFEVVKK